MTTARKRTALLKASVPAAALLVASCQQMTNVESHLPGGYLSDSSDVCHVERTALDSTGNTFATEAFRNALIGGAAGGLVAAVTGENIFLGIGIGAAAALAGTFIYDLQREYDNPVEMTDAAIATVAEENEQIDLLLTRFSALKECRKREADTIRRALAEESITRAVAAEQMAGVRERYREDIEQLDTIAKNVADRSKGYAAVYNQIAADNGGQQLVVDEPPSEPRRAARSEVTPQEPELAAEKREVLQLSNLRAGPGTSYDKVGLIEPGTEVTILASEGGWYRIVNPQGGEAYIAEFLLGPVGSGSRITTAPAPSETASARIENRPAEKPIEDEKLEPIVLPENERDKVTDLQELSFANVEKRDRVFEEVSTARAEEDEDFELS